MIELKQLEGQRRGPGGTVETKKQPTDFVLRDGQHIGFLARQDNALFCPIVELNPDELSAVVRGCQEQRDEAGEFRGAIRCHGRLANREAVRQAVENEVANDNNTGDDGDDD